MANENKQGLNNVSFSKEDDTAEDSQEVKNSLTFLPNSVEYLLNILNNKLYKNTIKRNNFLLDLIRLKEPISKYELAKISGFSYPTIKKITKNLEFCELIFIKISVGENGMPVKLICLEEKA